MNYYNARELRDADDKPTGRWHYTVANDGKIWPVGYCSPWESCPECKSNPEAVVPASFGGPPCATCEGKRLVRSANPCPGHATPAEACEHYRQYLLDHATYYGPKTEQWPKHKCAVPECNTEATHLINVDAYQCHQVCAAHANRAALEKLLPSVGWAACS